MRETARGNYTMKLKFATLFCLMLLPGCMKSCGSERSRLQPEAVVEKYLQVSLNMNDVGQREVLLDLTTGNLHDVIRQAPDELLQNAFIKKHFQLEKYSIVERRDRTPRETEVTFLLEYLNLGASGTVHTETAPRIKTENTVSVVKEKGAWLISDVIGKKTAIDFQFEELIAPSKPGSSPRDTQEQDPSAGSPAPTP